jgi:plastocyanin
MKRLRMIRRAVWMSLAIIMIVPAEAGAAVIDVEIGDFYYRPLVVSVRPGDTVRWTNIGLQVHSATGNAPLDLWDTEPFPNGSSFSFAFRGAGRYLYHCSLHFDMTAVVSVRPLASPPGGPVGTVFSIAIASQSRMASYVMDVQRMDPGGNFADWMIGITGATVQFDSAGMPPGSYFFRARLRRLDDNVSSLYSAPVRIQVTP